MFDFSNSNRFLRNHQLFYRSLTGINVIPNRRVNSNITWSLSQIFYPLESSILFWRISIYFIKGPWRCHTPWYPPSFFKGEGAKNIYIQWLVAGQFQISGGPDFFSIIEWSSKFKNCLQQSCLLLCVCAKFYHPYLEVFSLIAGSSNVASVEVSI